MINFVRYDDSGKVTSAGYMVPEAIALDIERGDKILEIEPRESLEWRGYKVDFDTKELVQGEAPVDAEVARPSARSQIEPLSDKEFWLALAFGGYITQDDALKAVQSGFIPSPAQAYIDTIQDERIRFAATMLFGGETTIYRQHPLIEGFLMELGMDAEAMDTFFLEATNF